MSLSEYLTESAHILHQAAQTIDQKAIDAAVEAITSALRRGKPLLICGNGGSASDAMHITGELVGRFLRERRAYRAICLSCNPSTLTAWSNDYDFDSVFSRQVEAYGEKGGVLLGISTSGNSRNVIAAFELARKMDMVTIALTGEGGGALAPLSDYLLAAPSQRTPLIQQVHICLYHYLCEHIERCMTEDHGCDGS